MSAGGPKAVVRSVKSAPQAVAAAGMRTAAPPTAAEKAKT